MVLAAEGNTVEQLATSSRGPVIAVDLDDVLSQTNLAAAQWHNETFGTNMDLSMFYYYHWWKNPYWGTPEEAIAKARNFVGSGRLSQAIPVVGAQEGVARLCSLGFRLVIVTAREPQELDATQQWIDKHFAGLFEHITCTGMPKESTEAPSGHEPGPTLSKAQVCSTLGAVALIDDALEHALACSASKPPTPVLLFGNLEWNKRVSSSHRIVDGVDIGWMSFKQRYEHEGRTEFWRTDEWVPSSTPLTQARDWTEVVRWFEEHYTQKA